ncbi:MAG: hypothetical protein OHK0046_52040 [Anaerolineae bacterium]
MYDLSRVFDNNILIDPRWLAAREEQGNKKYLTYKDEMYRMGRFIQWLTENHQRWYDPDLVAYRDYLLQERELSPISVQAHLSTIRGRYNALLKDNAILTLLEAAATEALTEQEIDPTPAEVQAVVERTLNRIRNSIDPNTTRMRLVRKQDAADSDNIRLTPEQVHALLRSSGIETPKGIRDTAIIAMIVCTGIREMELCNLDVPDLRQHLDGELALRVREGKGAKQRLVPYGPLDWCLLFVDRWLTLANITEGPVFRGFYKGGKRVRVDRLTPRGVIDVVANIDTQRSRVILIHGELRTVHVHDLRRTYARNAFDAGMDMYRIQQNLGHATIDTTLKYIGASAGEERRPPAMFEPPYPLDMLKTRWAI